MLTQFRNSIVTKTTLIHALIIISVSAIVLVSLLVMLRTQHQIKEIADRKIIAITKSAHAGRILNSVFAEANFLLTTFPEKDDYLESRQAYLLKTLQVELEALGSNEAMVRIELLEQFPGILDPVLDQCIEINSIFKKIRQAESDLDQELAAVDELLVNSMLKERGNEPNYLQHLGAMLSVYRESLYRIKFNIESVKEHFLSSQGDPDASKIEIESMVKDLQANLLIVGTSGQDFAVHGKQLLQLTGDYRNLLFELVDAFSVYQAKMIKFQAAQKEINREMEGFDSSIAATASQMQTDVKNKTRTAMMFIALLSAGIMVEIIFLTMLIRRLVAPITSLAKRARNIAKGQYSSGDESQTISHLLATERNDEIVQLAKDFEEMGKQVQDREKTLQENRSILAAALEATEDGVLVVDKRGDVSHFNERFSEIWAIPEDLFETKQDDKLIAYVMSQLIDPEQFVSRIKELYETSLISEDILDLIDGRILERYSYPLVQEGSESGRVWFFRDITERRKYEESLRVTQTVFEKSPVGIWRTGPTGDVLAVNDKACTSLGYTREELSRMKVFDFDPDFDSEKWKRLKRSQEESESVIFETRHRRKNGDIFPVQITTSKIQHGSEASSVSFVQDITERKKAEEELRQLRNYLSNIINSMPSVLVGVDRQGRITQWNKQAEQATGLPSEKAVSKNLDIVFARLGDQMESIKEAIRSRQTLSNLRVSRKEDNETRFEDITIFPLITNGVDGAVIRVDDITERVRMEEMMIQSEKMLSLGGLAAGMAHEVNNPLAGMIQTANVMKSRLDELDLRANHRAANEIGITIEQIRAFMEKRGILRMIDAINESGEQVAEIVDNMLGFAQKSNAMFSSHYPDQLMNRILELAATDYDLKKHYDFKKIEIIKEYEENLPMIPCEGAKIQQVLLNILRNGAQAMQSDDISNRQSPCFIIRLAKEGTMLRIEIEDNGPGMDKATQSRVFEPFFTTKPVGVGTGLGLSVSYFIITQHHGGTMDVISQPGKGSNFIIRLPLGRDEEDG